MADDPHDVETEGPPERRTGGGCTLTSAILLLLILAALLALAWLRSRHDAPNPALSGHPPSQRGI
jgi:hypothetical protein